MAIATTSVSVAREPRLLGQIVVVIGGSAGIGFETARLASSEGAEVVLGIARHAAPKMRSGGTLLLTGGSERKFSREYGITPAAFSVLPPFTAPSGP